MHALRAHLLLRSGMFVNTVNSKHFVLIVNPSGKIKCGPFLGTALDFLPMGYIIPPIPPPAGIAGVSSLILATTDSVVSSVDATPGEEKAFYRYMG